MRPVLRALIVALLVLAAVRPATAAPKVDSIVLVNGDRITCEVTLLRRGQLTVKTDDVGTLTVEWTKVVTLVTLTEFDISLQDGRNLFGRIDAGLAGQLLVVDASGAVSEAISIDDVVTLAPIRARFFQNIDGAIDVGSSYTQSSGIGQFNFEADATYRRPRFAASTYVSMTLTQQQDAEDSSRSLAQFGYTQYRDNRWVVTPLGLVESNRDLGFDLRSTGAFSLGRFLSQSNRGQLLLTGGLAVGRELPVDADPRTNFDALIAFSGSLWKYDFPKTNVDLNMLVFPALSNAGRVRINVNAKFRREIVSNLNLTISGYDYYDNRPLSDAANTNDIGYALSVGWTF